MSTINQKMGFKAAGKRRATKSPGIQRGLRCPTCNGRHVVEHEVNGRALRLCGYCGNTWEPDELEDETLADVERGVA